MSGSLNHHANNHNNNHKSNSNHNVTALTNSSNSNNILAPNSVASSIATTSHNHLTNLHQYLQQNPSSLHHQGPLNHQLQHPHQVQLVQHQHIAMAPNMNVPIKRNNHGVKLASMLNNMLQMNSLVDVTIYCDDGEVNAHKLVLAASSAYFRNLFSRMTNAFHYPIIVLREIPVNDLRTIIQFIYHGEVNVPQNRVDSVMKCANYLQVDGMGSSANSLNAVLASSSASMSHHALLAAPISGPASLNSLTTPHGATANHSTPTGSLNKINQHYNPQATPAATTANCKPSRGQSSRSNHSNNSNSNHGNGKHTCTTCFKTFTHGFTLKRHMKLHSQQRDTMYCDVCSKHYSCKDSFLRHKKSSGHLQHAGFNHRSLDMNLGSGR